MISPTAILYFEPPWLVTWVNRVGCIWTGLSSSAISAPIPVHVCFNQLSTPKYHFIYMISVWLCKSGWTEWESHMYVGWLYAYINVHHTCQHNKTTTDISLLFNHIYGAYKVHHRKRPRYTTEIGNCNVSQLPNSITYHGQTANTTSDEEYCWPLLICEDNICELCKPPALWLLGEVWQGKCQLKDICCQAVLKKK